MPEAAQVAASERAGADVLEVEGPRGVRGSHGVPPARGEVAQAAGRAQRVGPPGRYGREYSRPTPRGPRATPPPDGVR